MYSLEKKKASVWYRVGIGCLSFFVALVLYVSTAEVGGKKVLGLSSSTTGSFVMEDIKINYEYDRSRYEVVPYENDAYAVVTGDKAALNLMRLSGEDPEFTVDLTGKVPGKYQERVLVDGVRKGLKVEVFPGLMELRVMELQTLKMSPVIEIEKSVVDEAKSRGYVLSVPELVDVKEVRVRDIQRRLSKVGQVRGYVRSGTVLEPGMNVEVELRAYDRDGKLMNVNLIDREVTVRIPMESKVTVVKESVVKKIVRGSKKEKEAKNRDDSVVNEKVVDSDKDTASNGSKDGSDSFDGSKGSDVKDGNGDNVKDGGDSSNSDDLDKSKDSTKGNKKEDKKDSVKGSGKSDGVTGNPVGTAPVPKDDPVKDPEGGTEGKISFEHVRRGYEVRDLTDKRVRWEYDRVVDVSDFKEGKYAMVITDGGVKKTLRFEVRKIGADDEDVDASTSDKAGIVSEDEK